MKLLVLLSTYNGETYLRQQLDSLLAQTLPGVEILVRDDGSHDGTCAILAEYADRGALRWYQGRNLGASHSFWRLLKGGGEADYYAFCDQDDVWDRDKLARAVAALEKAGAGPLLYGSDVRVAGADLSPLAPRMMGKSPTDYPHALVKNFAPGCTFVWNRASMALLRRYDAARWGIDLHDWTAFQIIACLGRVLYDETPSLTYRQHGGNAIGAVTHRAAHRLGQIAAFLYGDKRNSRQRNARRLELAFGPEMTPEYQALTADVAHYREDRLRQRRLLRQCGTLARGMEGLLLRALIWLHRL